MIKIILFNLKVSLSKFKIIHFKILLIGALQYLKINEVLIF